MLGHDISLSTLAFVVTLAAPPARAQDHPQDVRLTVFAAASMKNAVDDINAAFTKATGIRRWSSCHASSALAKQIESGAPADLFAWPISNGWIMWRARSSSRTTPASICWATGWSDRAEGFQINSVTIGRADR